MANAAFEGINAVIEGVLSSKSVRFDWLRRLANSVLFVSLLVADKAFGGVKKLVVHLNKQVTNPGRTNEKDSPVYKVNYAAIVWNVSLDDADIVA